MNTLEYVIGGLLILLISYKAFTFLFFLRLKAKLRRGDLNTFINVLGSNYQHRKLLSGLNRNKWVFVWMTVKADFDENDKLICSKIEPNIVFSLRSQLLFTSYG